MRRRSSVDGAGCARVCVHPSLAHPPPPPPTRPPTLPPVYPCPFPPLYPWARCCLLPIYLPTAHVTPSSFMTCSLSATAPYPPPILFAVASLPFISLP